MRRLPPLNALPAFEAAARHLSFTRAADELHVTQAAISQQVRNLEDHLGIRLFLRKTRALELTPAGRAYQAAVGQALDDLDRATHGLRAAEGRDRVLTVSMTPTFMSQWLLKRLPDWQAKNPDLELRFSATPKLIDFNSEDVDAAVRFGGGNWPGLVAERLFSISFMPVCSPALLRDGPPLKQPNDLAAHTLLHDILLPDAWRMWLAAVGADAVDPDKGIRLESVLMTLQAAREGIGVGIAFGGLVKSEIAEGRLVAPFDFRLEQAAAYYLVTPKGREDPPKLRRFRKWLNDHLAAEPVDW